MSRPAGRTLRLLKVSPGQRAEWALTSSPRTAPCPPLAPAPTTKSCITTTTTTTICSSTPSALLQTLPPSSQPRAAQLATGRPTTNTCTTTEPPPQPPPTTATTTAVCLAGPSPLRPAPAGAPSPDQSVTPSCPTLRCCRRPTANRRLPPPHHHCPPPQSPLPTSPAWVACPSWCLHRTRQVLWCESQQNIFIILCSPDWTWWKDCFVEAHRHTQTNMFPLILSSFSLNLYRLNNVCIFTVCLSDGWHEFLKEKEDYTGIIQCMTVRRTAANIWTQRKHPWSMKINNKNVLIFLTSICGPIFKTL